MAPILGDVVRAGSWYRDDNRFTPCFIYLSEIYRLIMLVIEIVDGTMSELLVVEGAHLVLSDGCG